MSDDTKAAPPAQPPAPNAPPHPAHWLLDGMRLAAIIPVTKLAALALLGSMTWFFYSQGPVLTQAFIEEVRRPAPTPDAMHARALNDAVVRSRALSAVLSGLLQSSEASRASLWQFHNGSATLAGIPFLKTSQTNVAVAPGVASLQEQHQGIPLQLIIDWVPRLLGGECIDQSDDDASAPLRHLMRDGNIERLIVCPVFIQGLREPVGYLALSYAKGWPQPSAASPVIASLRASGVAVGAVLAAYRDTHPR